MVAIDFYINETTRHADIILPPVGPFEKGHYDLFYHTYNTVNWTAYNPPLFEPEAPGYTDFEPDNQSTKGSTSNSKSNSK